MCIHRRRLTSATTGLRPRQRRAIERFAQSGGYQIVDWFNDPAVSGADPIESRPGFAALLNRIVLVEDATQFARDLMAQELGIGVLIKLGMRVITANGDNLTETDDHMKVAMRQIAGAFSQLEKARLDAKLKAARDRKREANGKCEGRKSYAEARPDGQTGQRATSSRPVISQDCRRAGRTRPCHAHRRGARRVGGAEDARPIGPAVARGQKWLMVQRSLPNYRRAGRRRSGLLR